MKILLTGGSACGKSTFAEKLAMSLPSPRIYIATMIPYGDDGPARVARHRAQRAGMGFETVERYTGIAAIQLPHCGTALLECLCNLTANEMFEQDGAKEDVVQAVLDGVSNLARQVRHLIIVTNEVAGDGVGYKESVRGYVAALGEINRRLAAEFDCACELVCGIPIALKGELP